VAATRHRGVKAPETITVDGKPYSLADGRFLIYFFDPECLHCLDAAKRMATYNWGTTRVIVAPVQQARFAPGFLQDSGLKALITTDTAKLRQIFPFVSVPAAVALNDGHEVKSLTQFEGDQPGPTLKGLGFIY
jgi:hypothetical protein